MNTSPNLASVGQLICDPTRTLMLELMYDGRAWSATELASGSGITPQTASSHLRRLLDAGWIKLESRGRHRFYSLADSEVADALEALLVLATRRPTRPGITAIKTDPLRVARTCYDHMAGSLGVSITDRLLQQSCLEKLSDSYQLTRKGEGLMSKLGIDCESLRRGRRPFTRCCLDWSERRHHLGGALGAALLNNFFERRWIERAGKSRAINTTAAGTRHLRRLGLMDG